ncbi:hypothetical protein, partial [Rhizobium leguminosarum]|uniref:hypothetical protein n=1 Tax=Rhizobium leguminosarum TaxID=384 RepID=UPI003F956654
SYDFHVGQKVVCINDTFKHVIIDQLIRKGDIYTIRWVGEYTHYIDGTFIGVKLVEIIAHGSNSRNGNPPGRSIARTAAGMNRFMPARPNCGRNISIRR